MVTRNYPLLVQTEEWTAVRDPNDGATLAFSRDGELLPLQSPVGRLRRTKGGSIFGQLQEQFRLELDDEDLIQEMQRELAIQKTFPVISLFERLHLVDRLVHPEALQGSLFHWKRGLAATWTRRTLAVRCEYGVFISEELEKYVQKPKPRR